MPKLNDTQMVILKLRLEIDVEIPSGLDRAKVCTLVENANTLGIIDKAVAR